MLFLLKRCGRRGIKDWEEPGRELLRAPCRHAKEKGAAQNNKAPSSGGKKTCGNAVPQPDKGEGKPLSRLPQEGI